MPQNYDMLILQALQGALELWHIDTACNARCHRNVTLLKALQGATELEHVDTAGAAGCPRIVSRSEWGAISSKCSGTVTLSGKLTL